MGCSPCTNEQKAEFTTEVKFKQVLSLNSNLKTEDNISKDNPYIQPQAPGRIIKCYELYKRNKQKNEFLSSYEEKKNNNNNDSNNTKTIDNVSDFMSFHDNKQKIRLTKTEAAIMIIKNLKLFIKKKEDKVFKNLNECSFDIENKLTDLHSNNVLSFYKISLNSSKDIKFMGNKINSIKNGFGIQIWGNELKYIGNFKNDKINGYGQLMTYDENNIYMGEFLNNSVSGYGIYKKSDLLEYEGYWNNNLENDIGQEEWYDKSIYKGEYLSGRKNGIGTYIWEDGSKYEGELKNNYIDGYGIYRYFDDRTYLGQWIMNVKEGFGEYIWSNKKYIGFYKNDKRDGFGIYYWSDKDKAFVGFWEEGKQCGFGKILKRLNNKYGIWNKNHSITWFKNEEEAMRNLKNSGLKRYKKYFKLTLDEIQIYCNELDNINLLVPHYHYSKSQKFLRSKTNKKSLTFISLSK